MLRTSRLYALACLLPWAHVAPISAEPSPQPNVILIFADDQGTLDLNCYGSKDLYTPNLDDLAKRGLRFTQFYVGAPVCSPSRATLMTGRYPQRAGVPGNVSSHPGNPGMPTEQVTIAEVLHKAGYRTALFGKWHLGTLPECSPTGQGFDEFFGHKSGCIDNWSHFFYWVPPHFHDLHRNNEEVYEDGQHFTRLIAREARRFIDENKDRPFFLYLPFNIPHYPLQPYAEYREMYEKKEDLSWQRQEYGAWVSTMDHAIGEVLAKVDELKLREDTLIVFLSDHGYSVESRANGGGGNAGQFRGTKFMLWEGGIRVPCVASWPGRIPQGQVRGEMAVSADWLPTICQYCGVQPPKRILDGKSIVRLIESPEVKTPHEVFHWQSGGQWAVRRGDWKLVATGSRNRGGAEAELFLSNMTEDVTETKNIAAKHPEIVKELIDLHKNWTVDVKQQ